MTPGKEREMNIMYEYLYVILWYFNALWICEQPSFDILYILPKFYAFENNVCCYAVHALKLAMNNIEINTMFQMTMTTLV